MDTGPLFELVEEAGVRAEAQGLTGLYNKIKPFLADASRLPAEQIAVNRIGMFGDAETRIQAIERRHNKLPPGPPFFAGLSMVRPRYG